MHVIFAYFSNDNNDIKLYEKELDKSILKYYDLYLAVFDLLCELRFFAENKIEQRKNKHIPTFEDLNPNEKFVKNQVLLDIEKMMSEFKFEKNNRFQWSRYPEIIKHLYNNLEASDAYSEYMQQPVISYSKDKQILYYIIEHLIANNDELYDLLEDLSIYWNDDIEMALSMNIRTIQRMKPVKEKTNKLLPLFKNREEQDFVIKLFRKTIVNHERNEKIITDISSNWEADRIAKADKIILEIAMTELAEFPLVPIAVTMNEYIDMAKYYSTERSHSYINGMLENTVSVLKEQGLINKIGIGLIEVENLYNNVGEEYDKEETIDKEDEILNVNAYSTNY